MSTNLIGQVLLNQFRVDAFIASGGMGAVYRVWDLKRNVSLAMKVLHADMAEDPTLFKRFRREANALKKLAHPNIVPFYGLYQTDNFTFLLERYVDGPSLKEILQDYQGKPMPIREVVIYLKSLCAALGYAHANGVVHCDVKPGNVMIDQGGNIYLTDFGIARHADSTTTTLATVGTAAYMAPEQIRGEPVSPATDVYALGAMLFELVTGQKLYKGDEKGTESSGATVSERVRFGHLHLAPPDPRTFNPDIPETLDQVILKTLQKDPKLRFQSAQNFFITFSNCVGLYSESIPDRVTLVKQTCRSEPEDKGINERIDNRRPLWLYLLSGLILIGIMVSGLFFLIDHSTTPGLSATETRITEKQIIIDPMPSVTFTIINTKTQILPPPPQSFSVTPVPKYTATKTVSTAPSYPAVLFTADQNLMCRRGPDSYYEHAYDVYKGETYEILARWSNGWLLLKIINPRVNTRTKCCWVSNTGTITGNLEDVDVINYWFEDMRMTPFP